MLAVPVRHTLGTVRPRPTVLANAGVRHHAEALKQPIIGSVAYGWIFVVSLGTASFWSSALMLEVGWQIHDNGLIRPPLEVNLIPMLPVVSLYLSTKDLHF